MVDQMRAVCLRKAKSRSFILDWKEIKQAVVETIEETRFLRLCDKMRKIDSGWCACGGKNCEENIQRPDTSTTKTFLSVEIANPH